jgi:hypothetical protein
MIKPISPDDVAGKKAATIPDVVFEAINDLIVKNWAGTRATILQSKIVESILNRDDAITEKSIFEHRWLDIEDIYREAGWDVKYDKPAYNESYSATFIFKKVGKEE